MSKKLVVVYYEHRFYGYRSDSDFDGNAIFGDDLLDVMYVSSRKAKKVLSKYAAAKGLVVVGDGTSAFSVPEDPRYSTERRYIDLLTPGSFLFDFGSLRGEFEQAKSYLGRISSKDQAKYDNEVDTLAEEYDPF